MNRPTSAEPELKSPTFELWAAGKAGRVREPGTRSTEQALMLQAGGRSRGCSRLEPTCQCCCCPGCLQGRGGGGGHTRHQLANQAPTGERAELAQPSSRAGGPGQDSLVPVLFQPWLPWPSMLQPAPTVAEGLAHSMYLKALWRLGRGRGSRGTSERGCLV